MSRLRIALRCLPLLAVAFPVLADDLPCRAQIARVLSKQSLGVVSVTELAAEQRAKERADLLDGIRTALSPGDRQILVQWARTRVSEIHPVGKSVAPPSAAWQASMQPVLDHIVAIAKDRGLQCEAVSPQQTRRSGDFQLKCNGTGENTQKFTLKMAARTGWAGLFWLLDPSLPAPVMEARIIACNGQDERPGRGVVATPERSSDCSRMGVTESGANDKTYYFSGLPEYQVYSANSAGITPDACESTPHLSQLVHDVFRTMHATASQPPAPQASQASGPAPVSATLADKSAEPDPE